MIRLGIALALRPPASIETKVPRSHGGVRQGIPAASVRQHAVFHGRGKLMRAGASHAISPYRLAVVKGAGGRAAH